MGKELEIKFSLEQKDFNTFTDWLKLNANFDSEEDHEEWYLNNPSISFTFDRQGVKDADNYLRIRKTNNNSASVTLKLWQADTQNPGIHTHCIEHEFSTSDIESTRNLFLALGYNDITKIIKVRKIYNYENFEIVIDEVQGLGTFIEIELKEDFDDPKTGHTKIKNLIKEIGIKKLKEQVRGYVSMLWNPETDFGIEKSIENDQI